MAKRNWSEAKLKYANGDDVLNGEDAPIALISIPFPWYEADPSAGYLDD
jgi:hypothetical protein